MWSWILIVYFFSNHLVSAKSYSTTIITRMAYKSRIGIQTWHLTNQLCLNIVGTLAHSATMAGSVLVFFVEPQPNHPRHQTRSMPARTERRIQCHRPCKDQQAVQLQGNLCWNCQPSSSTCTQANWRTLQWYTCVSYPLRSNYKN